MKVTHALAIVLALATAAVAGGKSKKEVVRPAETAKFMSVEGLTGITKAEQWGGAKKAHGGLTKFAAGFQTPRHTHTLDVKMVVISGTIVHGDADGVMTNLGPGSYLMVPGGLPHTTACAAGAACLFYEEQTGEFDLMPTGAKK